MSETPSNETVNEAPVPKVNDDEQLGAQTEQGPSPSAAPKDGRIWQTLLVLLVAAALGGGGYFLWYDLHSTAREFAAAMASNQQRLDDLSHRADKIDRQINDTVTADIKTLQDHQQALEDSIANLRSELTGDARVWDVEEIATLLQIANDRLHLEKEIAPSLAALEAADRHLQALKNPALLEVRRLLAEEIAALRATAEPDIDGMALSLGALIQEIDRLPIAASAMQENNAPASTPKKGWRGIVNDLWETLKSLVSIRHRGQAERPLLAPDERYFLRQNLRLDLESARLALLRRDAQTYRQAVREAREWITLYFENDAPATAGALQELAHLQQSDIAPDLPDISGSLNALQAWLNGQKSRKPNGASGATHS